MMLSENGRLRGLKKQLYLIERTKQVANRTISLFPLYPELQGGGGMLQFLETS